MGKGICNHSLTILHAFALPQTEQLHKKQNRVWISPHSSLLVVR